MSAPTKNLGETETVRALLEQIESFPTSRAVSHCGQTFQVSPFQIYADCPHCGNRVKVRAFSAGIETEDVFDAIFAWLSRPGAMDLARERMKVLAEND